MREVVIVLVILKHFLGRRGFPAGECGAYGNFLNGRQIAAFIIYMAERVFS